MKLFILDYSDTHMIGNGESQARCLNDESITRLFIKEKFPVIHEPLQFKLHKLAKQTNCLSQNKIASNGLLIDVAVRKILDQFKLIDHKYYPVDILTKNDEVIQNLYFWLQLKEEDAAKIKVTFDPSTVEQTEPKTK